MAELSKDSINRLTYAEKMMNVGGAFTSNDDKIIASYLSVMVQQNMLIMDLLSKLIKEDK
jgi:hypothetical protein